MGKQIIIHFTKYNNISLKYLLKFHHFSILLYSKTINIIKNLSYIFKYHIQIFFMFKLN